MILKLLNALQTTITQPLFLCSVKDRVQLCRHIQARPEDDTSAYTGEAFLAFGDPYAMRSAQQHLEHGRRGSMYS